MKLISILFVSTLLYYSCTLSKYGFPYKTKVSVEKEGNTHFISIDTSELYGTHNYIQLDRKIGQPYMNGHVWSVDSIQGFWVESFTDTFSKDFQFYYRNKPVKIDSLSFFCTFKDSVIIDSSLNKYEYGYEKHSASNLFHFTISNEKKLPYSFRLIQDLTIYSEEKIYRFKNYILWL